MFLLLNAVVFIHWLSLPTIILLCSRNGAGVPYYARYDGGIGSTIDESNGVSSQVVGRAMSASTLLLQVGIRGALRSVLQAKFIVRSAVTSCFLRRHSMTPPPLADRYGCGLQSSDDQCARSACWHAERRPEHHHHQHCPAERHVDSIPGLHSTLQHSRVLLRSLQHPLPGTGDCYYATDAFAPDRTAL